MAITARQYEQIQARLGGSARRPEPLLLTEPPARGAREHLVLIGIDPSLRGTGFGVIRGARPRPVSLAYGTLTCPASWARSRCLARILEGVREVIRAHRPTVCVVEGLFYAQNLRTALIMGEARGAALAAAAEAGLEIYEMAPRKVKQSVAGYGGAQKSAVARMVQRLLQLGEPPAPDAADALALALAHLEGVGRYSLTPLERL